MMRLRVKEPEPDPTEYLHFRVPPAMREVVERISAARGASLAQTCRDLIMDSDEYIAACHPGHPAEDNRDA